MTTPTKHCWAGADDGPVYVNSEADQVEAEGWRMEYDVWMMLSGIEEGDEGNMRVAGHGMMKVRLTANTNH